MGGDDLHRATQVPLLRRRVRRHRHPHRPRTPTLAPRRAFASRRRGHRRQPRSRACSGGGPGRRRPAHRRPLPNRTMAPGPAPRPRPEHRPPLRLDDRPLHHPRRRTPPTSVTPNRTPRPALHRTPGHRRRPQARACPQDRVRRPRHLPRRIEPRRRRTPHRHQPGPRCPGPQSRVAAAGTAPIAGPPTNSAHSSKPPSTCASTPPS